MCKLRYHFLLVIFLTPLYCCFAQDSKSKSIDTALEKNTKLLNDLLKLRSSIKKSPVKTDTRTGKSDTSVKRTVVKPRKDSTVKLKSIRSDTVAVAYMPTKPVDTFTRRSDTVPTQAVAPITPALLKNDTASQLKGDYSVLLDHPYLAVKATPVYNIVKERQRLSKDQLFYLTGGLLMFLALIKLSFAKYFNNIFRLFFQPSFRQKQTREQLLQSNLPSLLLNLFFVVSAGSYISLLLQYYHSINIEFWRLLLYCSALLGAVYILKYVFLIFSGWVFNVKEATDKYIFIVYLINKILGVILIPFVLILAFSEKNIVEVSITIAIIVLAFLYLYRYFVSYAPVRREIKISPLHFLFFISAFEIIPLLLICKLLMLYLDRSL